MRKIAASDHCGRRGSGFISFAEMEEEITVAEALS